MCGQRVWINKNAVCNLVWLSRKGNNHPITLPAIQALRHTVHVAHFILGYAVELEKTKLVLPPNGKM